MSYVVENLEHAADKHTLFGRVVDVAGGRYGHLNSAIKTASTPEALIDALEVAQNLLYAQPAETPAQLQQQENLAACVREHIDAVRRGFHLSAAS